MQRLLSSRDRIVDPDAIETLKRLLYYFGATGAREGHYDPPSELEVFDCLPLVFGLLPGSALSPKETFQTFEPIKPLIRAHLSSLGVSDETLVDLLKRVADQYRATYPGSGMRKHKLGVNDLRAQGEPYRRLRQKQNNRCAVCGTSLLAADEELDHVVPWRLIGDPTDGANWRLLCSRCNRGKGEFLSSIQAPSAHNWAYRDSRAHSEETPIQMQWVLFAQQRKCARCGRGPDQVELKIVAAVSDPGHVVDHYEVHCTAHE